MIRKLMIKLRSFNIRYIKGHRGKLTQQESDTCHYEAVIASIPAMAQSLDKKGITTTVQTHILLPHGFVKEENYYKNEYITGEVYT